MVLRKVRIKISFGPIWAFVRKLRHAARFYRTKLEVARTGTEQKMCPKRQAPAYLLRQITSNKESNR